MARRVLAVAVGYITMFLLVFATFSAAYRGLGAERAFQPGTYVPTMTWNLLAIVLGFVAALAGGVVAVKVGGGAGPAKLLAAVVFVLGIAFAIPQITSKQDPGPRPGVVSNNDAMMKAQTPAWMALLNPLVGVLGVMAGARRARPIG
jgi:hypothetical protein